MKSLKKRASLFTVLHKIWFLQQLINFKSFKVAASNLEVTPSALTQSIKSLEKYYQQTLIIRENSEILATFEGEQLLKKMTPFLDQIKLLENQDSSYNTPKQLRIGTFASLGIRFLPSLYDQIISMDSNIKIKIQIGRTQELLTLLSQGHLDLALVVDAPISKNYYSKIIAYNSFSIFTHKKNINKGIISKTTGLGCISSQQDGRQSFVTKGLKELNLKSNDFNIQSDSLEILLSLCKEGKISALLPVFLANQHKDVLVDVGQQFNSLDLKNKTKHPLSLVTRKSFSNEWREKIELFFIKKYF